MFAVLLGKFWPEIAIGIAAVLLFGYIGYLKHEVSHYKAEAETIQAQYDAAVAKATSEREQLEAANASLSKQVAEEEKAYLTVSAAHAKTIQEKIKNDKELAAVKLSLNAIRLFNESKHSGGTDSQGTPNANGPDDGKAGTSQVTLGDLLAVSAENDANHLRCIQQVTEWQSFWTRYVKNVSAVGG